MLLKTQTIHFEPEIAKCLSKNKVLVTISGSQWVTSCTAGGPTLCLELPHRRRMHPQTSQVAVTVYIHVCLDSYKYMGVHIHILNLDALHVFNPAPAVTVKMTSDLLDIKFIILSD